MNKEMEGVGGEREREESEGPDARERVCLIATVECSALNTNIEVLPSLEKQTDT